MTDKSQQLKGPGDGVLSTPNIAIDGLNIAKDVMNITPAKAAFGTVAVLLTMIRVSVLLSCNEIPSSLINDQSVGQHFLGRKGWAVHCDHEPHMVVY